VQLVAGLWIGHFVSPAHGQSVVDLARSALSVDPLVAAAQAQQRAAEERVFQAKAAFGPTAAIRIDTSDTRYYEAPDFNVRPVASRQASLQVSQPLMRTTLWPALASAEAQLRQSEAAVAQARADAWQRLLEAVFDLFKARDAVSLAEAQQLATAEQLAAAKRSYEVGRSAITDVREAEAKADAVASQLDAARFDLDSRRQVVQTLAGLPVTGLSARGLTAMGLPSLDSQSMPQWLADARSGNPQVVQARHALEAAKGELLRAERAHAPSVDMTFSTTMSKDTGTATTFLPRRADSTQVGFSIQIPLFASGATQSKVMETMALRDKAEHDVEQAQRRATIGVQQAFPALLSALSQARGLETAVRSQELAVRADRRGYQVGMKVNAEVLDAQSKLFEARRDLARARYDAWLQYMKLRVHAGRLEEADLQQLDAALVDVDAALPEGPGPGAKP
jgi:outer membrane protein